MIILMRELLKTTDQRRLKIIETLIDSDNWMSPEELAVKVQTTPRNLREDLKFFRTNHPGLGLESNHLGIRLILDQAFGIQEFYRDILRSNLYFQLLEEIFFYETYSVEDLANILHTSPSTVYRAIDTLNHYFEDFNCYIDSNPCRFVGDEYYIRNFYKTYFTEAFTPFEWPFKSYKEEEVDKNMNRVISMIAKNDSGEASALDFAFYRSIKIIVLVNVTRYSHKHFVDSEPITSPLLKFIFNAAKLIALPKHFKSIPGGELSIEYLNQVFYPYIIEDMAFGVKSLNKIRRKNPIVETAISQLDDDLKNLADELHLTIDTDEILVALYGTAKLEEHDPNSTHILYNRNLLFNKHMQRSFPRTHQSMTEIIMKFRNNLGLEANEEKVHYLVYILFTTWENLLAGFYTQYHQSKILVLSEASQAHARTIRNLLSIELASFVEIETINPPKLTAELLDSLEYDLIVSNFKLPYLQNHQPILIGDYLTQLDIDRINDRLQSIIQNKSMTL